MYRLLTLLNTPRYSRTRVLRAASHAFPNLSHPSTWQLSLFTANRYGWMNISNFLFYQLMLGCLKCFSVALAHLLATCLLGRCPQSSTSPQSYFMGPRESQGLPSLVTALHQHTLYHILSQEQWNSCLAHLLILCDRYLIFNLWSRLAEKGGTHIN